MDVLKAAQRKAAKLQKHASQMAQDVIAQASVDVGVEGSRELTFQDAPLGFTLDGAFVASVNPNGQAAKLGVQVRDRIVAVAGYALPKSTADAAGEEKVRRLVQEWVDEMPLPNTVTFLTLAPTVDLPTVLADSADASSQGVGQAAEPTVKEAVPLGSGEGDEDCALDDVASDDGVSLQEALVMAQEQCQQLETELEQAREECQKLRRFAIEQDESEGTSMAQSRHEVEVRRLQEQVASRHKDYEASRRHGMELQAQLVTARAECDRLRTTVVNSEDVAREALDCREQVLEDEVGRLRGLLAEAEGIHQAESRAAEKAMERAVADTDKRISSLEAALAQRAAEVNDFSSKFAAADLDAGLAMRRLRNEHVEEIAKLTVDHGAAASGLQRDNERLAGELERAMRELSEAGLRLTDQLGTLEVVVDDDGDGDVANIDPEVLERVRQGAGAEDQLLPEVAAAEGTAVSAQAADEEVKHAVDVAVLHDRITYLETRCRLMQKKLSARPIVCQAYKDTSGAGDGSAAQPASGTAITWEPGLRALAGPQVANIIVRLYMIPDKALRRFTERLLMHKALFWLFYLHLLILYAIASSNYSQSTTDIVLT